MVEIDRKLIIKWIAEGLVKGKLLSIPERSASVILQRI